jgi:hypothetical protein
VADDGMKVRAGVVERRIWLVIEGPAVVQTMNLTPDQARILAFRLRDLAHEADMAAAQPVRCTHR